MADETTTQPDSTSSETTETVADVAAEQQAASDAEAGDEGTDEAGAEAAADGETSVLGAKVGDETGDKADEGSGEAAAGPPEKYELALEGVDLDQDALEAADPVFRELGLTNDQANKLMPVAKDFAERTAERTLAQLVEAGAQQKKDWLDAFKADPDIGGAKQEETEHLAAKALDTLGYPLTGFGEDKKQPHPFRKVLTETGFGNHPEMIRVFRRVGEMVGEDGFARPDGAKQTDTPITSRWYPKEKGD